MGVKKSCSAYLQEEVERSGEIVAGIAGVGDGSTANTEILSRTCRISLPGSHPRRGVARVKRGGEVGWRMAGKGSGCWQDASPVVDCERRTVFVATTAASEEERAASLSSVRMGI